MLSPRLLYLLMPALLLSRAPAQGPPDAKHMLDDAIAYVAEQQNADDGTYGPKGERVLVTARVLQAYGLCPRRYTEEDGPLVRKATTALRRVLQPDGGVLDPDDETRI